MGFLVGAVVAICILLLWNNIILSDIAARLKERFPTAKEQDYEWSQNDPLGHWEAHKDDKHAE